MTDTTTIEAPAPATAEPIPEGMTSENLAGFIELSVSIGNRSRADADAMLVAHGLKAPAPAKADAAPEVDTSGFNLTPEQLAKMTEWAVEDKLIAADQVAAPAGETESVAGSPATDAYLTEIEYVPAKAEELNLPPVLLDPEARDADFVAAHKQASSWVTTARLSKESAAGLAHVAREFAPRWAEMSEADRVLHVTATEDQLQQKYGDKTAEYIGLARQLTEEIEARTPGYKSWLTESGVGNDISYVTLVIEHARMLNGRHTKKG